MSIQHDDANKLAQLWKGGQCYHVWEKEYYLATQTGDYRCSICGDCISEETYSSERNRKDKKENERN